MLSAPQVHPNRLESVGRFCASVGPERNFRGGRRHCRALALKVLGEITFSCLYFAVRGTGKVEKIDLQNKI